MNSVNPYYLHSMLAPLAGRPDDDEQVEKYSTLNPNNETEVRRVIRNVMKPHFDRFDEESAKNGKTALRYHLTRTGSDFGRVFDSMLPPFSAPDDPRLFFVWLWQEFFPGESYVIENIDSLRVEEDINVTWKIKLSDGPKLS